VISLRRVERDRAERASELLSEITVVTPDASDDGSEDLDGFDSDVEDLKLGRGCLACMPFPAKEA
jgi:hypothetical protein